MTVSLSAMRDAAAWENPSKLKHFLGHQLVEGRVALVLGAGVSFGFGLPSWRKLVEDMFSEAGHAYPSSLAPPEASDRLYVDVLGKDDAKLVQLLAQALYKTFDASANTLRRNELLIGLAALIVRSGRGSASRIVSFNFDDVLERFLRYLGLTVHSVSTMPSWASAHDVRVYHPHGYTPQGGATSDRVVFTQLQYDKLVGDNEMWEAVLLETL